MHSESSPSRDSDLPKYQGVLLDLVVFEVEDLRDVLKPYFSDLKWLGEEDIQRFVLNDFNTTILGDAFLKRSVMLVEAGKAPDLESAIAEFYSLWLPFFAISVYAHVLKIDRASLYLNPETNHVEPKPPVEPKPTGVFAFFQWLTGSSEADKASSVASNAEAA